MSNLGEREKYGIILLLVVLIVFGIYMLGIRNLEDKYVELTNTKNELVARKEYYDQLRAQNSATLEAINQINQDISAIENSFIPEIKTEVLENYVERVFENNGCPYLVNIASSDIATPQIVLPDGTIAEDTMILKRIDVTYCTTDGFNIPQYNRSNTVIDQGAINVDQLQANLESMVWTGADSRVGFDEFVNALKYIESENEDCVLIHDIGAEQEGGYILLKASIDFYSVNFSDRVSSINCNWPYYVWNGPTSISTNAGFIGMPFIVEDINSEWYHVMLTTDEAIEGTRPFCTYYSRAIFEQMVLTDGLAVTLGYEDGEAPAPVEEPAE